jgi:mono/diheme cytochrome c family protein
MFRRLVSLVEILALVGAAVFVVMLFANEPAPVIASGGSSGRSGSALGGAGSGAAAGAKLFAANCATCHGAGGGGGIGPQLSDMRVVRQYPDEADEIKVVSGGRSGMPAFGSRLSTDEIKLVVEYTRTL